MGASRGQLHRRTTSQGGAQPSMRSLNKIKNAGHLQSTKLVCAGQTWCSGRSQKGIRHRWAPAAAVAVSMNRGARFTGAARCQGVKAGGVWRREVTARGVAGGRTLMKLPGRRLFRQPLRPFDRLCAFSGAAGTGQARRPRGGCQGVHDGHAGQVVTRRSDNCRGESS